MRRSWSFDQFHKRIQFKNVIQIQLKKLNHSKTFNNDRKHLKPKITFKSKNYCNKNVLLIQSNHEFVL